MRVVCNHPRRDSTSNEYMHVHTMKYLILLENIEVKLLRYHPGYIDTSVRTITMNYEHITGLQARQNHYQMIPNSNIVGRTTHSRRQSVDINTIGYHLIALTVD